MSFITRCPACHTAFKVVSDQLKISEGWVRCGHCQQIFDATLDLQPWWPGAESGPGPAAPPPPPPPPPPSSAAESAPAPAEPTPAETASHEADLWAQTQVWVPDEAERPSGVQPGPEPATASAVESEPTPQAGQGLERDDPPQPDELPDALAPGDPPLEPPPTPSFVRQAQRRALWRRPGIRLALALVAVLLLGALAVQAALHWRDPIAAHAPQAQPALETLCAPVGCDVSPPRQLDDIVIDSSVLLRRAPGRYTFNVVVRNTASVELAAPALELTLTDLQDQVLVRRVLLAEEWPEPRQTLAAGAEWPVQFELELEAPQDQVMSGYRALLFYP